MARPKQISRCPNPLYTNVVTIRVFGSEFAILQYELIAVSGFFRSLLAETDENIIWLDNLPCSPNIWSYVFHEIIMRNNGSTFDVVNFRFALEVYHLCKFLLIKWPSPPPEILKDYWQNCLDSGHVEPSVLLECCNLFSDYLIYDWGNPLMNTRPLELLLYKHAHELGPECETMCPAILAKLAVDNYFLSDTIVQRETASTV